MARLARRRALSFVALATALMLASGCTIENAKKHYVLAEKLWYDGKYAAAVAEFDKVTAKDTRGKLGLQAEYRSAVTQSLFLSQYEPALKKFRAYADATTDRSNAWEAEKQIGEILYSKIEHYDEAITHYDGLIKQRPDADEIPDFKFRVARSQFFLWRFDDAVATYQDILKQYRGTTWAEKAAFEIGRTYFTRGEQRPNGRSPGAEAYQEAIDAYTRFLKLYPHSAYVPEAQFGVASCLEEMDQLDAAYHAYEVLKNTYPAPKVIAIKLARIRERKAQRSR